LIGFAGICITTNEIDSRSPHSPFVELTKSEWYNPNWPLSRKDRGRKEPAVSGELGSQVITHNDDDAM
jgi:hypothetical protein